MNVLVLGAGGREHAIVRALRRDPDISDISCISGNPGISLEAMVPHVSGDDVPALRAFVNDARVDLVIPGPESFIASGVADALRGGRARVFAPTRGAARIESSKIFGAEIREHAGIPAPRCRVASSRSQAYSAVTELLRAVGGVAVKADGLCAGKGVVVTSDEREARIAVDAMMRDRRFGDAGASLVIEEQLVGPEVSVLAICDGERALPLVAAQDYKRLAAGNRGPNTGGMGALAPAPWATDEFIARVLREVFQPVLRELAERGTPFRGVLYAGLLLDSREGFAPKVLEFNARFGDPETQVVLPLLEDGLGALLWEASGGALGRTSLRFATQAAVCVVLAASGYPTSPRSGDAISGIGAAEATGAHVYHAGTRAHGGQIVTAGGRVFGITAMGASLRAASSRAHAAASLIRFDGVLSRDDVGLVDNGPGANPIDAAALDAPIGGRG